MNIQKEPMQLEYYLAFSKSLDDNDMYYVFEAHYRRMKKIAELLKENEGVVFLFLASEDGFDDGEDFIFVFDRPEDLNIINYKMFMPKVIKIQCHTSYEGAYNTALLIKETNKLCYDNDHTDN